MKDFISNSRLVHLGNSVFSAGTNYTQVIDTKSFNVCVFVPHIVTGSNGEFTVTVQHSNFLTVNSFLDTLTSFSGEITDTNDPEFALQYITKRRYARLKIVNAANITFNVLSILTLPNIAPQKLFGSPLSAI